MRACPVSERCFASDSSSRALTGVKQQDRSPTAPPVAYKDCHEHLRDIALYCVTV